MSDPVNSFIVDFLLFSWLAFFSFCLSPITIFYKLCMEHFALVLKIKTKFRIRCQKVEIRISFLDQVNIIFVVVAYILYFSVLKLQFSAKSHIERTVPKLKFGIHFWIRWTSFSFLFLTFFNFCLSQTTIVCKITHATVPKLKFGIPFWIRWTSAKSHMEHFIFDISKTKTKIQNSLSDPVNNVSSYFRCFSDIL